MKQRTEEIVRKLYQNKQHRQILGTIFEHRPTLIDVGKEIEKAVKQLAARSGMGEGDWWHKSWRTRADNPQEMKMGCDALYKRSIGIQYGISRI